MNDPITINSILTICTALVGFAGGVGVVVAVIKFVNSVHDFKQQVEKNTKDISDNNSKIENAHKYATDALKEIQTDTDAKLQEIKAEQCMLTYCMMATLDGLHQLGCNGKVTEARSELDKFMNKQAHDQGK